LRVVLRKSRVLAVGNQPRSNRCLKWLGFRRSAMSELFVAQPRIFFARTRESLRRHGLLLVWSATAKRRYTDLHQRITRDGKESQFLESFGDFLKLRCNALFASDPDVPPLTS